MKVYIVGSYTQTPSNGYMYCRAFATEDEANEWIETDQQRTALEQIEGMPQERVEYQIFDDDI